jgi:uncharacterized protein
VNIAAVLKAYLILAATLLADLDAQSSDGSHDLSHTLRVLGNAAMFAAGEGGSDLKLLLSALILSDCVASDANSPL